MIAFERFLLRTIGTGISLATTIIVFIYGWGLEPLSWWWIIGGYLAGQTLGAFFLIVPALNDFKQNTKQLKEIKDEAEKLLSTVKKQAGIF